jgi:uncharacterized membrane protein YqjE
VEEPEHRTLADEAARLHTLVGSAQALIENGQSLMEAELAFQKARAGFVLRRAKGILALGALALALLFFVLMALIVGLLLALAPLLGPWGALGAVLAGLLLIAALCVLGVIRRIGTIRKALKGSAKGSNAA